MTIDIYFEFTYHYTLGYSLNLILYFSHVISMNLGLTLKLEI